MNVIKNINFKDMIAYIKSSLKFTIFDKYIVKEFIKPYLGSLLLIVILTNVTELFEKMDTFLKNDVNGFQILLYYFYKSPFLILQFSPVAVMFASVFSLGLLAKNKELIAVIIGGVNFFRVVLWLYIIGFLLSIGFVFFNELIVVRTQEKVRELNMKFKKIQDVRDRQDFPMYGKQNYFYHIYYYHFKEKKMDGVKILQTSKSKDRVKLRIDANHAIWSKERKIWVFHNGIIRHFNKTGHFENVESFVEKDIALPEKPKDFEYKKQKIDELTIGKAWEYIQSLKHKGFKFQAELVDFNLKFSFPFSLLLMMLIGAPLSMYSSKSVLIISFGFALMGSLIYWILLSIGISLGKNGVLPPVLAVWIGNFIFAGISYFVHKRIAT